VILTDVQLTLTQPSLAVTVFVADSSNKTFIAETVGTPGRTRVGPPMDTSRSTCKAVCTVRSDCGSV
jgi:hypothetical protein